MSSMLQNVKGLMANGMLCLQDFIHNAICVHFTTVQNWWMCSHLMRFASFDCVFSLCKETAAMNVKPWIKVLPENSELKSKGFDFYCNWSESRSSFGAPTITPGAKFLIYLYACLLILFFAIFSFLYMLGTVCLD